MLTENEKIALSKFKTMNKRMCELVRADERSKVIDEVNTIIHSKDDYPYLDEDDYGNIVYQICQKFGLNCPE